MTVKKEMSVNESLAKVNKILRSAGDLILPRETNIALSILADVACQQQEEIDILRERVQSRLPSDTSDVPERRIDKSLLIVLDALGRAPVLDVLGREPICNDTIKYARGLFLHIESKVKDLIRENKTLRNAEKCKSQNLPMTIEHSIELNGTTTINSPAIEVISHLIKDGSIPLGEKHKEDRQDMIRSIHESLSEESKSLSAESNKPRTTGCIKIEDNTGVTIIPVESIIKIKAPKFSTNVTQITLSNGVVDNYEIPSEKILEEFRLARLTRLEIGN